MKLPRTLQDQSDEGEVLDLGHLAASQASSSRDDARVLLRALPSLADRMMSIMECREQQRQRDADIMQNAMTIMASAAQIQNAQNLGEVLHNHPARRQALEMSACEESSRDMRTEIRRDKKRSKRRKSRKEERRSKVEKNAVEKERDQDQERRSRRHSRHHDERQDDESRHESRHDKRHDEQHDARHDDRHERSRRWVKQEDERHDEGHERSRRRVKQEEDERYGHNSARSSGQSETRPPWKRHRHRHSIVDDRDL